MSENPEEAASIPSREWTKFVVLAVILAGTIFVMALARPFIFNRVVPAVMGEGQLTAPMPTETVEEAYPAPEALPDVPIIEEPPVVDSYPIEEENETEDGAEMGTAVPTISHTVQHGDTMLSIARRYNVTVTAIAAANNISNPNHIEVGMTLLIPQ